jgi:hypothetical protein
VLEEVLGADLAGKLSMSVLSGARAKAISRAKKQDAQQKKE